MKIKVIRGQNQIGGSIIEISTQKTAIILDIGIRLDEGPEIEIPEIEGLFSGTRGYDAVLISHYHMDHAGLLNYMVDSIPVYMGENAYKLMKVAAEYQGKEIKHTPIFYKEEEVLCIGDIKITPYLCDHSSFDSYMFFIEGDGKKVLYTGDYRNNGRLSFEDLVNKLPEVDALITEGTTLSRDVTEENIQEETLEKIGIKAIENIKGPVFVMYSPMNTDRTITLYNIAKSSNRTFLQELYVADVSSVIGDHIPNPTNNDGIRVFLFRSSDKNYNKLLGYGNKKIGKKGIVKKHFIMTVRASMLSYLKKLSEEMDFNGGLLFYSMWKGYQENESVKALLDFMKDKGVKIHILHTSGHADSEGIDKVITKTKPFKIIPVHTENSEWFNRYEPEIDVIISAEYIEV